MIDPTKRAEAAAGPPTLQMPQQAPPVNRTGNAPTSALNNTGVEAAGLFGLPFLPDIPGVPTLPDILKGLFG